MLLPCTHGVVPLRWQTSIRSPIGREDLDVLTCLYHHVLVGRWSVGQSVAKGERSFGVETSFICGRLFHSSCRDSNQGRGSGGESLAELISSIRIRLDRPCFGRGESESRRASLAQPCSSTSCFAQSARGWPAALLVCIAAYITPYRLCDTSLNSHSRC